MWHRCLMAVEDLLCEHTDVEPPAACFMCVCLLLFLLEFVSFYPLILLVLHYQLKFKCEQF